jgi:hypothetical protein
MGSGLLFGKMYQCGRDLSWEKLILPVCPQPWTLITVGLISMFSALTLTYLSSLIFSLVSTLSMLFLIVWPLYVLWGVDLPPKEKRLVLILFGSTIFMAPFVGAHAAYSYSLDGTVEAALFGMTAHTEVILSLASSLKPD